MGRSLHFSASFLSCCDNYSKNECLELGKWYFLIRVTKYGRLEKYVWNKKQCSWEYHFVEDMMSSTLFSEFVFCTVCCKDVIKAYVTLEKKALRKVASDYKYYTDFVIENMRKPFSITEFYDQIYREYLISILEEMYE